MKIGIVGKGNFGTKTLNTVKTIGDVIFVTGKEFSVSYDIDWVIIASSNDSHYEIVNHFLEKKINVFCEKPLSMSYKQSKQLIELSNKNNVKLYIDDIFLYKNEFKKLKKFIKDSEEIEFIWNKFGTFTDNIFNNLTYHDIYMLISIFGKHQISNLKFKINQINKKSFSFSYGKIKAKFEYDRVSKETKKLIIGKEIIDFSNNTNDALYDMLYNVLNETVDFKYNNDLTLHSQSLLDVLNKNTTKIAIAGAGIFGLSSAFELKKQGFDVTVYETNPDILQNASSINQYRLHRGYHYPRSLETAISSKNGVDPFLKEFNCLPTKKSEHYYCIAIKKSLTSLNDFIKFINKAKLDYEISYLDMFKTAVSFTTTPSILNKNKISATFKVKEELFDPFLLKKICDERIKDLDLRVLFNTPFSKEMIENFDYVINCSYANLNCLLDEKDQLDLQFELCEKPVIKLADDFKNKSVVIMDGPFMCIDPLGDTDFHLMGNVVHAIHNTNTGKFPIIPEKYKSLLNKGIIKNPPITNIEKFIESAKYFFDGLETYEHIGSMFVIRTVFPKREYDDARPSIILKHDNKLYSLFSGKISTCVNISKEITNTLLTT